jgi:hypothetical protein
VVPEVPGRGKKAVSERERQNPKGRSPTPLSILEAVHAVRQRFLRKGDLLRVRCAPQASRTGTLSTSVNQDSPLKAHKEAEASSPITVRPLPFNPPYPPRPTPPSPQP